METENLYENLINLQAENIKLQDEKEKLQERLDILFQETQKTIRKFSSAEDMLKVLQNEIEEKKEFITSLEAENLRMNKILTIRSNAERANEPKKDRCGYIVKKCRQMSDVFKIRDGYDTISYEYICWEYVFETPYKYDSCNRSEWVRRHIFKDNELFSKLNLTYLNQDKNQTLEKVFYNKDFSINYAFDLRLELNMHNGFWNFSIKTLCQIRSELDEDIMNIKK